MNKPHAIKGAIFDLDGTLLDEYVDDIRLHERARLAAMHTVGKRHGIPELQTFTLEQATEAFVTAKEHSIWGALWQSLVMLKLVDSEEIDRNHYLVQELAQLKHELFEEILRTEGKEVPGASAFVHTLAVRGGLSGALAIASNASRRDIDIFLSMTGLSDRFPDKHIVSIERLTHAKPHPEAFDLAFRSFELPDRDRPHVLAFEDHPRGITSAKAAGLFTCAITTLHDRDTLAALPVAPDLIADSFAEFEQLLLP